MSAVKSRHDGTRRALLCASAGALCAALFTIASPLAAAPVTINIVDPAGNLALTQDAFERIEPSTLTESQNSPTKAPAPEIPAKLKAMQGAGRSDIDSFYRNRLRRRDRTRIVDQNIPYARARIGFQPD
jgi:hypothetical protein